MAIRAEDLVKKAKEFIEYKKDTKTKIAYLTLNRPDQYNATTIGMRLLYGDLIHRANIDDNVKVLVIRGAGDLCVEEARFVATHTGALHTPTRVIPPTGSEVDLRYSIVHTVENGRITSFHLYFDQAEMLMQLGLMPLPAAAG